MIALVSTPFPVASHISLNPTSFGHPLSEPASFLSSVLSACVAALGSLDLGFFRPTVFHFR